MRPLLTCLVPAALLLTPAVVLAKSGSPFDTLPEAKLPLALQHDGKPVFAKMSDADVLKQVVKPLAALSKKDGKVDPSLAAFATKYSAKLPGEGTRFGLISRVKVNGATVLLSRLASSSGEGMGAEESEALYLLVLDAGGAIVAAGQGAAWSSNMAYADVVDGTLSADGTLVTRQHLTGGDGEREGETRTVKIASGELQKISSRFGPDGMFRDEKSRELMAITSLQGTFASAVAYRARAGKPPQALEITARDEAKGTLTVRFPKSPKDYLLSYSADRSLMTCRNPDGTVQLFQRAGLSFEEPKP